MAPLPSAMVAMMVFHLKAGARDHIARAAWYGHEVTLRQFHFDGGRDGLNGGWMAQKSSDDLSKSGVLKTMPLASTWARPR